MVSSVVGTACSDSGDPTARPGASTGVSIDAGSSVEPFIEEAGTTTPTPTRAPRAALVTLAERGEGQLCTLVTAVETEGLLGPSLPPAFVQVPDVGAGCRWTTRDRTTALSFTVLSTTTFAQSEEVAEAAARQGLPSESRTATVAGLPARIFDPIDRDPLNADARIVVALGEPSDPVVEVRSPDPALSLALAQLVAPRLVMLSSTPLPAGPDVAPTGSTTTSSAPPPATAGP